MKGPPPLHPFGLILHHDGSWSHEGIPIRHERLRAAFDRGVRYLPDEAKFVVQLGHFRGQIEVEEAAFFVRSFESDTGELLLSDGSRELLQAYGLCQSQRDGALLCRVKHSLIPAGLLARFSQGAQAALFLALEEADGKYLLRTPAGEQRISV